MSRNSCACPRPRLALGAVHTYAALRGGSALHARCCMQLIRFLSQKRQSLTAHSASGVATCHLGITSSARKVVPCVRWPDTGNTAHMCTGLQVGGDIKQPWLMSKYDVIHKTRSTYRITMLPEQDRATAIGNMHKKFGEDRTCSSEDTIADRQTHTDTHTQTDTLITILRSRIGSGVIIGISVAQNCRLLSQVLKNFPETLQADICLYLNDKLLSECSAFRSASPGQQLSVQARAWLSHALCAPGQHTAKRRRKCTRQSRSCW